MKSHFCIKKFKDEYFIILKFENGLIRIMENFPNYTYIRKNFLNYRAYMFPYDSQFTYIHECFIHDFHTFNRRARDFLTKYYDKTQFFQKHS